jgi:hypothetical protein
MKFWIQVDLAMWIRRFSVKYWQEFTSFNCSSVHCTMSDLSSLGWSKIQHQKTSTWKELSIIWINR